MFLHAIKLICIYTNRGSHMGPILRTLAQANRLHKVLSSHQTTSLTSVPSSFSCASVHWLESSACLNCFSVLPQTKTSGMVYLSYSCFYIQFLLLQKAAAFKSCLPYFVIKKTSIFKNVRKHMLA